MTARHTSYCSGRTPYIAATACLLLLLVFVLQPANFSPRSLHAGTETSANSDQKIGDVEAEDASQQEPVPGRPGSATTSQPSQEPEQDSSGLWDGSAYIHVSSRMTPDHKWFPIDFGDYGAYNPNLIAHPWMNDTWYMIAQTLPAEDDVEGLAYASELVCAATYLDGKMQCLRSPLSLPIASTTSDHCIDHLALYQYKLGPNDARAFYGPDRPYITYGSASHNGGCLGQWIQDLRRLARWNGFEAADPSMRFFWPTELRRPGSAAPLEKNWFMFWDAADEMYIHYDIYPKRAFAKITSDDGRETTDDLAPLATRDDVCIERYMPRLEDREYIHQATNSLAIIMCKRDDPACDAHANTFIFTIFHHKEYHESHNLYEPYIMLFAQTPPFGIHSISSKPFWINGRGKPGANPDRPSDQSEMMYITSMSWKDQRMYRGYMDDELMISFGIEDLFAGAIDVVARDLFKEMHLCV